MDRTDKTPEVLTDVEAAAFLRSTVRQIRKEAREGRLPAKKIGRNWIFSRRQLLADIEGQRQGS